MNKEGFLYASGMQSREVLNVCLEELKPLGIEKAVF